MSKYSGSQQTDAAPELIRELARVRGTGFGLTTRPDVLKAETLAALRATVTTLQAKSPTDLESYRTYVLGIAQAVADAKGGGMGPAEAATIAEINRRWRLGSIDRQLAVGRHVSRFVVPARSMIRRHALSAFFAGSVGLGSLVTASASLLPNGATLLPLIAIPVSYVPAVLAVAINRATARQQERATFRRRTTDFHAGAPSYGIALVGLPLVHVGGVALATLARGKFPVHPEKLGLFPLLLITSVGEEIGWRGYALPKLQERFDPFTAALDRRPRLGCVPLGRAAVELGVAAYLRCGEHCSFYGVERDHHLRLQ